MWASDTWWLISSLGVFRACSSEKNWATTFSQPSWQTDLQSNESVTRARRTSALKAKKTGKTPESKRFLQGTSYRCCSAQHNVDKWSRIFEKQTPENPFVCRVVKSFWLEHRLGALLDVQIFAFENNEDFMSKAHSQVKCHFMKISRVHLVTSPSRPATCVKHSKYTLFKKSSVCVVLCALSHLKPAYQCCLLPESYGKLSTHTVAVSQRGDWTERKVENFST